MSRPPLIIGHRGASQEAPENTLAAFDLAFRQGADGIEADFRLTRDGEIVSLHDDSTSRTGEVGLKVEESTLAELAALDLGRWKGSEWAGARIPTLKEVLALLPPGKLLFLEVKSGPRIVEPLARVVAGSGVPAEGLRLLCFSAEMIRLLKEALPGHRACWLADYRFRGAWHPSQEEVLQTLHACGADGLASRDRAILDRRLAGELRARSLELHVWTVDRLGAALRLCGLGVDSIMTNRPGWLKERLAMSSQQGGEP